MIDPLPDCEFPKTFFSSVTRKTFGTVGVDAAIEFIALDLDPLAHVHSHVETSVYPAAATSSCWSRSCSPITGSALLTAISSTA